MKDITNQRFGRWTAMLEEPRIKGKHPTWIRGCDCGKPGSVDYYNLITGKSLSCGCLCKERTSAASKTHGCSRGGIGWSEWKIWKKAKGRCYTPTDTWYHRYGGRGIKFSDEWKNDFAKFYADMGPRPTPKHTLDRIDNNGNYCSDNCQWSTRKEQANNRSSSRVIVHEGQTKTLMQWSEILGIKVKTLHKRLKTMSVDQAFTKKI